MMIRFIPKEEQIEAVLSNAIWTLNNRYFGNGPSELKRLWTASVDEIIHEARSRGLETFVEEEPGGEGVFLLRSGNRYKVNWKERAANIHTEYFDQLEPAFERWILARIGGYVDNVA